MGHGRSVAGKRPAIPGNSPEATCGDAGRQLEIPWSRKDLLRLAWSGSDDGQESVADLLREYVRTATLKETAHDLDERESSLAHELAERDYHEPPARLLVLALIGDKSHRLIRELCRLAGVDCVERSPLTDEEELRRTREWLRDNPALRESWEKHVRGGKP